MPTPRDAEITLANDVLAATDMFASALVGLEGRDPVRDYIPAVSPQTAAALLTLPLAAINRHLLDRHLTNVGRRKRMIPMTEIEALRGGREITIREYFTALGVPRSAEPNGNVSTAGEEKSGSISPPRTSTAAVDTSRL
jgi:hypothetical protein